MLGNSWYEAVNLFSLKVSNFESVQKMHVLFIMGNNPKNGELLGKTFQWHVPYSQVEGHDDDDIIIIIMIYFMD